MKYELKTISPVHIGTGTKLSHIDGFYANGKWHRVNLDAVLADPNVDLRRLTNAMGQPGFRWPENTRGLDLTTERFHHYALNCPQDPTESEMREAMKDVMGRPYIPGSSIKGAIRTAIVLYLLYDEESDNFDRALGKLRGSLGREGRPVSPASRIEKDIMGQSPNEDLLRAIRVSDTNSIASDALEIGVAWTVTLDSNDRLEKKIERGREYKIFVEQIRQKQSMELSITIDEYLFSERAKKQLKFDQPQEEALRDVATACNQLTSDVIAREIKFFEKYDMPEMVKFYDDLYRQTSKLTEGVFILCLGWGTGHHTKTILNPLVRDEDDSKQFMLDIRKRLQLGESRSQRGVYDEREFPKTRRILYDGQKPLAPLGWVQITPKE